MDAEIWLVLRYLNQYMPRSVRNLAAELKFALEGIKSEVPQWNFCVTQTADAFQCPVSRQYISRHTSSESRALVTGMFDEIKDVFRQSIMKLEWMDEETRSSAIRKLAAMKSTIAYTDELYEISNWDKLFDTLDLEKNTTYLEMAVDILRLKALHDIQSFFLNNVSQYLCIEHGANGYYEVSENRMIITAAILNSPFFDPSQSIPLNYGAIGNVIAHEIVHAFDTEGSKFDADANQKSWWTNTTWAKFAEKTDCIKRKYNNYKIAGSNINGSRTLDENIGDIFGAQISFKAYKNIFSKQKSSKKLPGISLTEDQSFLVSTGQIYCELQTPQSLFKDIDGSSTAPAPIRVIGSLSNSDYFAKAFNCPSGSVMHPVEKCPLY